MLFTSSFSVRATVATNILDAPARSSTRAHSDTVVPVVNTSSTSRISRPAISSGRAHGKCAAKILTALMARESDLGLGFASPLQHSGVQTSPAATSSEFHSMLSDQLRLVEAALTQLPRMQRHGDDRPGKSNQDSIPLTASASMRPSTTAAGLTCSYFSRWINSRKPPS